MSKLFFVLKKDLERITKPTMLNFLSIYFFPRGEVYRYTFWLRILQHVKSKKILKIVFGLPVYFIFRHYEFKYGIHANSNMVIGEGKRKKQVGLKEEPCFSTSLCSQEDTHAEGGGSTCRSP